MLNSILLPHTPAFHFPPLYFLQFPALYTLSVACLYQKDGRAQSWNLLSSKYSVFFCEECNACDTTAPS